jgi:hypothetical protein
MAPKRSKSYPNDMNTNCLEKLPNMQDHTKRLVEYFLQNKPFSKNQRMSFDPFIICLYLPKV